MCTLSHPTFSQLTKCACLESTGRPRESVGVWHSSWRLRGEQSGSLFRLANRVVPDVSGILRELSPPYDLGRMHQPRSIMRPTRTDRFDLTQSRQAAKQRRGRARNLRAFVVSSIRDPYAAPAQADLNHEYDQLHELDGTDPGRRWLG